MSLYRSLNWIELIFISVFVVCYGWYLWRTNTLANQLKTTAKYVFLKLVLRVSYFALILVALLNPSFGEVKKEVKAVGKDIFIAIDLSLSMNAQDIKPSRLERVKYGLDDLVDAFGSDRIGLIIFSSEAFIQCPLTEEQSAVRLWLDAIHTGLVPRGSTEFEDALNLALDKLINQENENVAESNHAKVIILISDGEDFGEDTQDAVDAIKKENVKLFTLGVGTREGGKIPVGRNTVKIDRNGDDVITKLNNQDLKDLAETTGGKYFEISEERNDLKRMINTINQIEGDLRDTKKLNVSANKYYYFLYIALFLIALDVLFTVKVLKI